MAPASVDAHTGGTNIVLPAVSIFNIVTDVLHTIDLGVAHYILGNVFFEIAYAARYFPHATSPSTRIDALWRRITNQYHHRGTTSQLSNLPLTFFCGPTSPHTAHPLLTSRVKGADTRHLIPKELHNSTALCEQWREARAGGRGHGRFRHRYRERGGVCVCAREHMGCQKVTTVPHFVSGANIFV